MPNRQLIDLDQIITLSDDDLFLIRELVAGFDRKTTLSQLKDNINAIVKSILSSNSIIKADSDNTPAALTIPEQTLVGRITSGVIDALTVSEVQTLLNVEDGADVTDTDNVNSAGAVMESDYDANTILVANSDNTPIPLTVNSSNIVGRKSSGGLVSMTPAEVLSELSGQLNSSFSVNSNKIVDLPLPDAYSDAVNKGYVDAIGLPKKSVRVLVTTNITLNGLQTIDEISLSADDRVGVIGQTDKTKNGIYDVKDGEDWVRSSDCDGTPEGEVSSGMCFSVREGSTYAGWGVILITKDPIIVGTTELEFTDWEPSAASVLKGHYDANTILKADFDEIPTPLTIPEQTLVGRITAGVIDALTPTEVRTLINVEDGADVTDTDNVDSAGAVMESDYDANTILKADSDNIPSSLIVGEQTLVGRITSGNISALNPVQIRSLLEIGNIFKQSDYGNDLQTTINAASSGDTIILNKGVIDIGDNIITLSKRLTFIGHGTGLEGTTITSSHYSSTEPIIQLAAGASGLNPGKRLTFLGVTFDGKNLVGSAFRSSAIINHVSLIDVDMTNFTYYGIFCDAGSFTDWITDKGRYYGNSASHLKCGGIWKECKIYNTLFDTCGSVAMYFSTGYVQDFLLKDSSVINSSNLGIYLYDNCNNVTIENTVIARNGYGSESEACGIKFSAHAGTSVEQVHIIGCTFDRNGTGQATFDDGHSGTGIIMKASGVDAYVSDVLIEDCKFIRNKHAAIRGYAKSDAVMSDNIVVQNCEFINNGYGVHTLYASAQAATIDAQYNFWGSDDGPGDEGSGSGDQVTVGVTYTNYLTSRLDFVPQNNIEIYVDNSRTDTYAPDGSILKPYKNISDAMTAIGSPVNGADARKKITVKIKAGEYDEDVIIPKQRMISLLCEGTVIIGDGAADNLYNSTTPRNLTIQNTATGEPDGSPSRYMFVIKGMPCEVSSTHSAYGAGNMIISGDLQFNHLDSNVTSHESCISGVKVQGDVTANANELGSVHNITICKCFFDNVFNLGNANINICRSTEFDGLITAAGFGRFESCEIDGGLTGAMVDYYPPNGFYHCDVGGGTWTITNALIDYITRQQIIDNSITVTGGYILLNKIYGNDVEIEYLGTLVNKDIQDFINNMESSMFIGNGGEITVNSALNGTIDISSIPGYIRVSTDFGATIKKFEISNTIGMSVANGLNYIYVNYNSGSPIFSYKATAPNHITELVLGKVYKESGTNYLHILNGGQNFYDFKDKLLQTLSLVWGIQRAYGLDTTESGTYERAIKVSSGLLCQAQHKFLIEDFASDEYHIITGGGTGGTISANNTIVLDSGEGDISLHFIFGRRIRIDNSSNGNDGVYTVHSSSWDGTNTTVIVVETSLIIGDDTGHLHEDTFTSWYYNGSTWISIEGNIQIDNLQYNNITSGLATLIAGRYGVHWIYIGHDGHIHHVYGQGDYLISQAEAATAPPSLPDLITAFCSLAAKIIIQKSSSTFESITFAWSKSYASGSVYKHDELAEISGGLPGERNHLSNNQLDNLFLKTIYDANTIIKADSDNNPIAEIINEQELVGRITSGLITGLTPAEVRTLINVEDGADVTDSVNVNSAGAVMESDYDANTILVANSDNTPSLLTIPEQTLVGRITSGDIDALTVSEAQTLLNVEDGADVTDSVNVDASGATMNTDTDISSNSWVLDEDTMLSNDDTKVPTQQSVKKYVDDNVIGLFEDKGNYDASTNTPDLDISPSGILKGDVYTTSVAGDFFTQAVEVGDVLRALQDDPTQLSHWAITQTNLDAPSIKTLYESNDDTNAFTDAEKTLLGNQSGTNTGDEVSATDSIEGIVELATIAEIDTGTDESRVITPAGLAGSALQSKVDGIEENADVTDSTNVSSALGSINVNAHADITSSGANIEDAVTKRHSQNTDTQLDSGEVTVDADDCVKINETLYFDAEYDNGNSGSAKTVNWKLGNKQKVTLTADCTFTFTAPSGACNLILRLIQDTTAGWDATWPVAVIWLGDEPTWTDGGNSKSIIAAFYFDGTNYWSQGSPWQV